MRWGAGSKSSRFRVHWISYKAYSSLGFASSAAKVFKAGLLGAVGLRLVAGLAVKQAPSRN